MNQDPGRLESTSTEGTSSELQAIDQAMLLALARRPRALTPLTEIQEKLLDDWVSGRLSAADADQAAALTKRNGFAAERVFERRLIAASNEGPEVPAALASKVLGMARPAERPTAAERAAAQPKQSWWASLTTWQWSGLGAAVAATLVVALLGVRMMSQPPVPGYTLQQFAMVNIDDRTLLGPRATRSLQTTFAKDGYRDLEIPTALVQRTVGNGRNGVDLSEWTEYLPGNVRLGSTQVMIDRQLGERVNNEWKSRPEVLVRVLDLNDGRWTQIRQQVNPPQSADRVLLVTVRP